MAAGRNWLVNNEGQVQELTAAPWTQPITPYRLYRFLSDLDDLLLKTSDDRDRLQFLCAMARQLLSDSPWLQLAAESPDRDTGWSVSMLYDEPDYPITVQMVSWQAESQSPIHNHGTWGLVYLLAGCEKNRLWQRTEPTRDRIELTQDLVLEPGDILCFLPDAIHDVEALGTEETVSFNLYGETEGDRRFRFEPTTQTATSL
ncbi:MAG: cupin [Spirulinaceae cyanobacterium]